MKRQFLKPKSTLLILLLVLSITAVSQKSYWTEPQPVTDSATDNINPIVILIRANNNGENGFVFYEKSSDTGSSAIYMQNLNYTGGQIEVLADTGVHYRNPQFIQFYAYPTPDTLFYMFFESDKNGKYDIWYSKYSKDGHFTGPSLVFNAQDTIRHLHIHGDRIVWEDNGKIYYSFKEYDKMKGTDSFAIPVVIDSGNCESPVISERAITYLKKENDSLHVWNVVFENKKGWTAPEALYASGNNESLSLVNGTDWVDAPSILWENRNNNEWKIMSYNYFYDEFSEFNITADSKLFPSALFLDFPINKYANISWLTFNRYENNSDEIFVNPSCFDLENFITLTDDTIEDIKPYINIGHYYSDIYYIFLFWQSRVNNHWQLFYSTLQVVVGIDEKKSPNGNNPVNIFPNPTEGKLNLSIAGNKTIRRVEIFNQLGQKVMEIKRVENTIDISQLSKGIYFIQVETEKGMGSEKFIVK